MMAKSRGEQPVRPKPVTPPGITILENIRALSMTQVELAERMGRPLKTVNEIIKGKTAITAETALQLERVIGAPAHFWLTLDARYREYLIRKREARGLSNAGDWLNAFPIKSMIQYGWINRLERIKEQVEEVLRFFGIASTSLWQQSLQPYAAFRRSATAQVDERSLAAWLRKGEIEATRFECNPFDEKQFHEILLRIRPLTREKPGVFVPVLRDLCANAGIAVVFVRELPKTRSHGVARWLSPDKALIQLSTRYKSDDQIWFSFFHEAGHILLDGKRIASIESDDEQVQEGTETKAREDRANAFAAETLIPQRSIDKFLSENPSRHFSRISVEQFAKSVDISPGIVVGRLQHDGILGRNILNGLKSFYDWPDGVAF